MAFFKSIALAFSMFSSLPAPRVDWNEKNMRFMMCAFPLVGVFISILCALWFILGIQILYIWQKPVSTSLLSLGFTLIPILVTGGIHLDGFMDTCDALGSHAPREKKLEILKDSHSGAFAILGCAIYLLSYFVFSHEFYRIFYSVEFSESNHWFVNTWTRFMASLPFLSVFVLSRLLSAFAVSTFPIAKNSGLLHTFASASARKFTAVCCGFFFVLISTFVILLWEFSGTVVVVSSLLIFVWYFFMARRNFGGITGDTAGWFVQMCELVSLAASVLAREIL